MRKNLNDLDIDGKIVIGEGELESKVIRLESMITVYDEHIQELEKENKVLEEKIKFLEQQLNYKSMGRPTEDLDMQTFISIGRSQQ